MAYTGIFCTEAEMQFKAGENRDTTGDTEANHNQIAAEVESFINSTCRYNFSDSYASMSADVRAILKEAASNLCAVYLIQYNMAGYSSRIEAEDMINILMSRFNACIEILKDQKLVTYLNSTATGTQASDSTDEITITKNASGVISVVGSALTNIELNHNTFTPTAPDTTNGGISANYAICSEKYTTTQTTIINNLTVKNGNAVTGNIRLGIYTDNEGSPTGGIKLGDTALVAQSGTNTTQTIPLIYPVIIPKSASFWIVVVNSGGAGANFEYKGGTSIDFWNIGSTTLPTTLPAKAGDNPKFALGAKYV